MKRKLSGVLLLLFLYMGIAAHAQEVAPLRFSEDGTFKIVQFTDTHYKWGKKASEAAVECIKEVLDAEQPDLVILTGDQVYSKSVAQSLPALLGCISERKIPFAMVFGNHDAEFDCTNAEMYDLVRKMPYCIMPDRDGVDSPDYLLTVLSNDSTRTAAVFYCMDTHARGVLRDVAGYAWLRFDQIEWYREHSDAFQEANGGEPVPSLAFFHIPLPEYALAEADEDCALVGSKGEDVCSPKLNSGMFAAIKEQGDIMATFCGHDHDNDFAVMYHGVMLAYGRYSGGKTVYNHLGKNGARVILLKEGERTLDTWIRLRGDEIINEVSYPDGFLKKSKKNKARKQQAEQPAETDKVQNAAPEAEEEALKDGKAEKGEKSEKDEKEKNKYKGEEIIDPVFLQ
ncbi:MAG: metallophosphoesterase family protein [Bacteroides sp.]|nr:metallophosphoesterase family protein [Bacteroides sp.]